MGLGAIGGVLKKEGHEIEVWSQDMHHWPDDYLRIFLDENKFDVVVVSLIAGYYQYKKVLALSRAINSSKNRPTYIMGGYGPTPEPKYFLDKTECDIICLGEGEITAVKLMDALENKTPLEDVPGVAWKDIQGNLQQTERAPQVEDLDSLPLYPYELFPMHYYRMVQLPRAQSTDFCLPMMSARGCTFVCTFCYRMDPGYRKRDPKALLDEIEFLQKEYGITRITFQDDLLMSSVEHTYEVCNEFIKRNIPVTWDCNGRLNYCSPDLLRLMKQAGCVFINYGIESMDQKVLNEMKKGLSPKMVLKGIEDTLDVGISPGFNFIFGSLHDTKETLKKSVDFLLKYDDFSQKRTIRPVTPYPGSPLYFTAIEMGLLDKDNPCEDFYERKHLNSEFISANFTDLTDEEFYECLNWANKKLMKNYYDVQKHNTLEQIEYLYKTKDVSFRGFRRYGGGSIARGQETKVPEKEVNWEGSQVNDANRFSNHQGGQTRKIDGVERYIPKEPIFEEDGRANLFNISRKTQAPSRVFQ
jgi:radical SAM superfamily enzyme YgiQ (UPF0313 family)